MSEKLMRKKESRGRNAVSLWMDPEHKAIYDELMTDGVQAAEYLRLVVYPELKRLKRQNDKEKEQQAKAG